MQRFDLEKHGHLKTVFSDEGAVFIGANKPIALWLDPAWNEVPV